LIVYLVCLIPFLISIEEEAEKGVEEGHGYFEFILIYVAVVGGFALAAYFMTGWFDIFAKAMAIILGFTMPFLAISRWER